MAKTWHYRVEGEVIGPITSAQLLKLAAANRLSPSDQVSPNGGESWTPAGNVKGLFPVPGSSAQQEPIEQPAEEQAAAPEKLTFRDWYEERFGDYSVPVQGFLWLAGGYLWIPLLATISGVPLFGAKGERKARTLLRRIAIGFGMAFVFLILLGLLAPKPDGAPRSSRKTSSTKKPLFQQEGDVDTAKVISKSFVKQHLQFPEEAEFPWSPPQATPLKEDPMAFFVFGTVTSKNAFGVKKKLPWGVFIEQPESSTKKYLWKSWKCYGVIIDGQAGAGGDTIPEELKPAATVLFPMMYSQIHKPNR